MFSTRRKASIGHDRQGDPEPTLHGEQSAARDLQYLIMNDLPTLETIVVLSEVV